MTTSKRGGVRRAVRSARVSVISVAACAVALVAIAGPAVATTSKTVIGLETSKFGKILIGPNKHTLYVWCKNDQSNQCTHQHSTKGFYPLIAHGKVVTNSSWITQSQLRTITLKSGKKQVTYYREPLYTYVGDKKPGQTYGERKQHVNWWAVQNTGQPAIRPGY